MKRFSVVLCFLFGVLLFGLLSACDLSDLLNRVEVMYDVHFHSEEGETAEVFYMDAGGELMSMTISPGMWTYNGIFKYGQEAGVWMETDATRGSLSATLIIWYEELTDREDYLDGHVWSLPISERVGLSSPIQKNECFNVRYNVSLKDTDGSPVTIRHTSREGRELELSIYDGTWSYSDCFESGSYASVYIFSSSSTGTASVSLVITYNEDNIVRDRVLVDFASNTLTGGVGKPVY